MNFMYIASDGNYGEAQNLVIVDHTNFTETDYEVIDFAGDEERGNIAAIIAKGHGNDPIATVWMTADEAHAILHTINTAQGLADMAGQMGLAEELGDIRDVFTRSGIIA